MLLVTGGVHDRTHVGVGHRVAEAVIERLVPTARRGGQAASKLYLKSDSTSCSVASFMSL